MSENPAMPQMLNAEWMEKATPRGSPARPWW